MDLLEAVNSRKSIRGYKSDPVPKEILKEILEVAVRAPSADNSQPWEITVIAGPVLKEIAEANVEALNSGRPAAPDVSHKPYEGIYRNRQIEVGKKIFELMDISRGDQEKRKAWISRGFRFFDAPAAFILAADESLDPARAASDIGGIAQTICLDAQHYGLGTCITSQGVLYADIVKQFTRIPKTKKIYWSISIGYPDWDFPANQVKTGREPLQVNTTWLGFDE
ncbi:MAG: nitroreductase [Deltaproteobacteria bacterium]|nr:nitroreductase [Deltaproteobacteria bacterium]